MTMLAMAAACTELYGPEPTPIAPDTAAGVEITVSDVKDDSFTVTVTPTAESAYYSWLVDESPAAAPLDSSALYSVSYESIAQGTAKWAADAASTTFTVSGLAPNTTYQIYAVAGSPLGIVGSVAVKAVTTSDGVNPVLADFKGTDGQMLLAFSEPVYPGEGAVTVRYFARKTSDIFEDKEAGVYEVPADSVACNPDGSVVISFAGEVPAGAYFTACYPEGTFVDSVGNKAAALQSGFYTAEDGSLAPYGTYGRNDFVPFNFADTLDVKVFTDPTQMFTAVSTGAPVADYGEGNASVYFVSPGKTVALDLVAESTYAVVGGNLLMVCPEAPDFGSKVVFSFEEDAVQDIWGNPNAAVEFETLISFGYTLEDVVGTYAFVAPDNVSQSYVSESFVIEESDDAEKGNVMITSFVGIPCMKNIYGTFGLDDGSLSFYGSQAFYAYVDDAETPEDETDDVQVAYYFYTNAEDYLVLSMPESGVLNSPNDYFGVAVAVDGSLSHWSYLFLDFEAEMSPVEEAPETSVAGKVTLPSLQMPLNGESRKL